MACTNPKKAWLYGHTETGKKRYIFYKHEDISESQEPILIPCGSCLSCKLTHSKDWAIRLEHQQQMTEKSAFLTLTYNDEHLPQDNSISKKTFQDFIRLLRLHLSFNKNIRIKYFGCGEYGDSKTTNLRPHYHIIIYGYDFPDKTYWKTTESGAEIYRSRELETLWQFGYSSVGEVNYDSAAYVARYTIKKAKDIKQYELVDTNTGELIKRQKPFILMSKGIGEEWYKKYQRDTDKDYLLNNKLIRQKVPRYYDKLRDKYKPGTLDKIKEERQKRAKIHNSKEQPSNESKDIYKRNQTKRLNRSLDNET